MAGGVVKFILILKPALCAGPGGPTAWGWIWVCLKREANLESLQMQPAERIPIRRCLTKLAVLSVLVVLVPLMAPKPAAAEIAGWDEAVQPLDDGVPQVAVMRLRDILKRPLSPADQEVAAAKLGEALL